MLLTSEKKNLRSWLKRLLEKNCRKNKEWHSQWMLLIQMMRMKRMLSVVLLLRYVLVISFLQYEAWKVRELRRIKRDREDREKADKDKDELDHLHQLTDEQREQEFKLKPKMITNKQDRGKMKFLQKYYHRGVFYLDEDDEVFKRDFAQPTLEDHFDKTILPKVMQVKKFGLAGRTKYTHLVDQDTTGLESESPWAVGGTGHTGQTGQTGYTGNKGPTVKRDFTRPSAKKRKT
eukprot:m.24641 g.24641  ORF g.24641 m.24641 type:complete len:233 (+) comp28659_c0_seq2:753-1451(+)